LLNSGPQISQMNADKRSGRKTQEAITCRSWIHQDRRLGTMTDQASLNDGGSRVDHQCELPTILSLQALDGLSAPESRIQAVPETAEAGAPMNRDLRNCCDPYLNHALLFCSGPGGPPWFKGGVEPGRAPAGGGVSC